MRLLRLLAIAVFAMPVPLWAADSGVALKPGEGPAAPATAHRAAQDALWAFQPVRDTLPPTVRNASWPVDEVDRYILAALEAQGLAPAADADRFTWLRRVSLDLTGLPPTPGQIADFIADPSPGAYARVVDRLLASHAFGERWARHWLDLVGYADQLGLDNNIFAEFAWRYRDYVIDAFNADKPFDRFVREQLAGDLLPYQSDERRRSNLIATGFLVLGDINIAELDKTKLRVDVIDQQVDKVGRTFLGMTIGCARCHDHKIDPILQTDYYGIGGIFYSTESTCMMGFKTWSTLPTARLPESPDGPAQRQAQARENAQKIEWLKRKRNMLGQCKVALVAIETSKEAGIDEDWRDVVTRDRRALNERMAGIDKEVLHDEFFIPKPPCGFAVHDLPEPADMRITIRGNAHALGNVVPRGFVRVIAPAQAAAIPPGQSGRRQLADWIVDPANPLTARVTVNRIWQKLFGAGLVRSVDNFGRSGETPSHPQLLDSLARRFMKQGWSQKELIRALVLSRAYRMSSANDATAARVDPDNRLLWRMNRCRMDAEALRDSLLAVSGKLIESSGGPAIPLEYTENSFNLGPGAINPPGFNLNVYRPDQPFQRTIYLPIIRSAGQPGPAEVRNAFDFIQPAICAGQRSATSVPTQAMFLMNSTLLKESADDLAKLITQEPGDEDRHLQALWLRVLNRPIAAAERDDARQFLDQVRGNFPGANAAETDRRAWTELCHALLASNEFLIRL